MKKDFDLERGFDEYFEAGKAPDVSVCDGAKNLISKPRRRVNASLRRALVAAACAAGVFLSGTGLYFFPTAVSNIADTISGNHQAGAPFPPYPDSTQIEYYGADGLTESALELYSDDAPRGLDFVRRLDGAANFSVNSINGYSSDGNLAFVKTELSAVVNAKRHDTVVYTEYTQRNSACELFGEYYDGQPSHYAGYAFLCFDTEENGEPVKKLYLERDGVKYYLSVASSDEYAYRVWLDLITQ